MSLGVKHRKIEMGHKNGSNGRWEHRADAKHTSRRARRLVDRSYVNGCVETAQAEYRSQVDKS